MKLFLSAALMVGLSFSLACPAMDGVYPNDITQEAFDYVAQQAAQAIPASAFTNIFNGSGSTLFWGAGALGAAEIVRRTVSRVLANRTRRLELAQRDREFMEGNQAAEAAQLTEIAQRIQVNNGRTRVRRNRRQAPQAAPAPVAAKPAAMPKQVQKPAAPKLLAQQAQAAVLAHKAAAKPATPIVQKTAAQESQRQPFLIRPEVLQTFQDSVKPAAARPLPKPAAVAAPKQAVPGNAAPKPAPSVVMPKPAAKPAAQPALLPHGNDAIVGISQAIDAAIIDRQYNTLRQLLQDLSHSEYRAVFTIRNAQGNTPMHTIVNQNDEEALETVLSYAPDAESIDYLTISDRVTNAAGRTVMQKANDERKFDFVTFIAAQRKIFQRV